MHKSENTSALPPYPAIRLCIVREATEPQPPRAFLRMRRLDLVAHFGEDPASETFRYDLIERTALDAVIIAPYYLDAQGRPRVVLRSAIRPPVAFRPREVSPMRERTTLGHLWEVPAGLVEASERSEEGLRVGAARELYEEIGAKLPASDMVPLGPSTFPAPGVIAERHFFFRARVDPTLLEPPAEDGSVLERGAALATIDLEEALALVRAGELEDAKTEIALRRLAETAL